MKLNYGLHLMDVSSPRWTTLSCWVRARHIPQHSLHKGPCVARFLRNAAPEPEELDILFQLTAHEYWITEVSLAAPAANNADIERIPN